MLTLTPQAQDVVRRLTDRSDAPDGAALRIAAEDGGGLALSLTTAPEPGDQVVQTEGAEVYLDSTASTALADQTLDAVVDGDGQVRFSLAPPQP